ncbi:MAG: hypothetical protein IJQ12_03650 [Lachnospiraceae bacterium]|nr:hypothetical protein [Lachnospiraceae bacterium]
MKKNSKGLRVAIVSVIACLLCGCGAKFPEMSQHEYDQVVNYAAGFLIRYAKGSYDKLTYLDPSYTPSYLMTQAGTPVTPAETPQETTPPATQEPDTQTPPEEPVQTPPEEPAQETGEPEPADGEPATETPGEQEPPEEGGTQTTDDGGYGQFATAIESSILQSIAPGIEVEYMGYSVRNAYPDAQAQGAVIAATGDRLLIVDFRLRNLTGNTVSVNTAFMGPQYKLLINGDVQGFTLVTMIANDLSSLLTDIPAGSYLDAVLLMELPEDLARNIDTLSLVILQGGNTQTIHLE